MALSRIIYSSFLAGSEESKRKKKKKRKVDKFLVWQSENDCLKLFSSLFPIFYFFYLYRSIYVLDFSLTSLKYNCDFIRVRDALFTCPRLH